MRACTPLFKASYLSLVVILVFFLNGCATPIKDSGFSDIQSLTNKTLGKKLKWVQSDTDASQVQAIITPLLTRPLSVDDALTIALLNNQSLQASYAELGISQANLVQAGRLPNPTLSFGRLTRGSDKEIERTFMLPIINLLTMPLSTHLEKRRFEQTQLQVALEVLRIADETRRAYFSAITAAETVKYLEKVKIAAEAASQLAERMHAVGNWSALQKAREQFFYTDTTAQWVRARQTYQAEREKLIRLLGLGKSLSDVKCLQLPDRLPALPNTPKTLSDTEITGLQNRLDIVMAQRELAGLANSLELTTTTRFINLLDISYLHNNTNESPIRETGYEIELQIPLFDWGSARIAKAEALYMQAVNRAAEIAITARSEIRESYVNYRSAHELAQYYRDKVVPLKKQVSDEQLLRYNGMLISIFELLADSREQSLTVNASIEALRDFWIADSALQMALSGRSAALRSERNNNTTEARSANGH